MQRRFEKHPKNPVHNHTDPPYADVEAYSNLARLAKSKLRNGGLCVAYSGTYYLPDIMNLMAKHLTYWWTFALPLGGQHSRMNSRRVFQAWKPILAFSKGKVEREWIVDCLPGRGREKTLHAWQQAENESEYLISKLSNKGELVVDPYAGSGTTLAVAKRLGRRYLGCEIDKSVARGARARIAA